MLGNWGDEGKKIALTQGAIVCLVLQLEFRQRRAWYVLVSSYD